MQLTSNLSRVHFTYQPKSFNQIKGGGGTNGIIMKLPRAIFPIIFSTRCDDCAAPDQTSLHTSTTYIYICRSAAYLFDRHNVLGETLSASPVNQSGLEITLPA